MSYDREQQRIHELIDDVLGQNSDEEEDLGGSSSETEDYLKVRESNSESEQSADESEGMSSKPKLRLVSEPNPRVVSFLMDGLLYGAKLIEHSRWAYTRVGITEFKHTERGKCAVLETLEASVVFWQGLGVSILFYMSMLLLRRVVTDRQTDSQADENSKNTFSDSEGQERIKAIQVTMYGWFTTSFYPPGLHTCIAMITKDGLGWLQLVLSPVRADKTRALPMLVGRGEGVRASSGNIIEYCDHASDVILSSPSGLEVESRCATEFIAEVQGNHLSPCISLIIVAQKLNIQIPCGLKRNKDSLYKIHQYCQDLSPRGLMCQDSVREGLGCGIVQSSEERRSSLKSSSSKYSGNETLGNCQYNTSQCLQMVFQLYANNRRPRPVPIRRRPELIPLDHIHPAIYVGHSSEEDSAYSKPIVSKNAQVGIKGEEYEHNSQRYVPKHNSKKHEHQFSDYGQSETHKNFMPVPTIVKISDIKKKHDLNGDSTDDRLTSSDSIPSKRPSANTKVSQCSVVTRSAWFFQRKAQILSTGCISDLLSKQPERESGF
uniref:Uncharacterized protein n=1 Tax=Timema poppense TaxID=170557 RepID=A0A7R9GWP0_TIMPO|nr:unnamed protein product [Timema poppensis]